MKTQALPNLPAVGKLKSPFPVEHFSAPHLAGGWEQRCERWLCLGAAHLTEPAARGGGGELPAAAASEGAQRAVPLPARAARQGLGGGYPQTPACRGLSLLTACF